MFIVSFQRKKIIYTETESWAANLNLFFRLSLGRFSKIKFKFRSDQLTFAGVTALEL